MDNSSGSVVDVTQRLAEALPDFLPDWSGARLYLVSGQAPYWAATYGMRTSQTRGGLSAGTLRRISDYIDKQLSDSISLHDLASMAGLSHCHFAKAFKQSIGMPPHRYIIKRRIEKAMVLIQATDRPLSQIALDVGCCDQSHFSRLIARATGITPLRLRRESSGPADKRDLPGVVT